MSGIPTGRTTPSGIPSGRVTPSGIPSGRVTPSGRTTPSGIPSRGLGMGHPSTTGRSTPVGGSRLSSGGRRESLGLASPLHMGSSGSGVGKGKERPMSPGPSGSGASAGSGGLASLSNSFSTGSMGSAASAPGDNGTSVQVALRIRPSTYDSNVPTRFQRTVVNATNSTTVSVDSAAPTSSTSATPQQAKPQRFLYDRVYSPDEGQSALWSSVEPLVARFMEGYNVTVLAYGQTSSGKSYTMGTDRMTDAIADVPAERLGVIPRAVHMIFSAIKELSSNKLSFTAKTSYVEIYNEDLIDLLASAAAGAGAILPQVQIREDKDGRIIWSGLREVAVKSVDMVMENLEAGSAVRQTNSTDMNAQSSRSHAIFSITLAQRKYVGGGAPPTTPNARLSKIGAQSRSSTPTEGHRPGSRLGQAESAGEGEWVTITSKFHFVDLAGSERLKRTAGVGERMKEGISINAGLHALGNVISALGDPSKARTTTHIPYRDSKLTRLLQDSLGGNAHTMMIACVSPSEYNLNETLNTLKYANRARNIKNRAELNEVEVGWDDIDYLQNTVTKLRKELNYLRSGNAADFSASGRPLASIDEEGSAALLAGKAEFSDLQSKYAKALSDLAVAQSAAERPMSPGGGITQSDFEGLIQPVVEEYEKSITALESQLALMKVAMAHSEESMKDQEERLDFEQQVNETNAGVIGDLKSRLAKVSEREAMTESYIRDIEAKLKSFADNDETNVGMTADLKKEIAKYRETEGKSEGYIRELEAKLGKNDELVAGLRAQVEMLEKEVLRREEAYRELESRVALLDTTEHQKMLLMELDEREKKVMELERTVDQHSAEKAVFEREKQRLEGEAKRSDTNAAELQTKIKQLEAESAAAQEERTRLASTHTLSPRSLTPPATPAYDQSSSPRLMASPPSDSDPQEMSDRFMELQDRYDRAVTELEVVNAKYRESVKELEDLSNQVEEARLISSERSDLVPSPSPVPSPSYPGSGFPNGGGISGRGFATVPPGADEDMEQLSSASSSSTAPAKSSSIRSRRSVPINPSRISFLGRPPTNAHGRSLSLSQELSSVHGSLLTTPNSPRSLSPINREPERSYESLEKEIMQLQEVLKEREEEIGALERSLHDLRRQSTDSGSHTSDTTSDASAQSDGLPTRSSSLAIPGAEVEHERPLSLSPGTVRAFDAIKAELAEKGEERESDEKSIQRLDDLMRSMAKKESAHLELIDNLKDKLSVTSRQHEDLQKLSRDQVVNMSTEIDALRQKLGEADSSTTDMAEKLAAMDAAIVAKQADVARSAEEAQATIDAARNSIATQHEEALAAQKADHVSMISRIQEEHAVILRRMVEEREALFVRRMKEFEDLQAETVKSHEDVLAKRSIEHEQLLAAKDEGHARLLQEQSEAHRDALSRLEAEHSSLKADADNDLSSSTEKLLASQAEKLTRQQSEHAAEIASLRQSLQSSSSSSVEQHQGTLADLQKAHDESLVQSIEDHSHALSQVRDEHSKVIAALEASRTASLAEQAEQHKLALADLASTHSQQLEELASTHEAELHELRAEHEEILVASLTELDSRRAKKHEKTVATIQTQHEEQMAALSSTHEETMKKLIADHETAIKATGNADSSLPAQQSDTLSRTRANHSDTLTQLKEEHAAALASQQTAHDGILQSLKTSHEQQLTSLLAPQATALSFSSDTEALGQQVREEKFTRLAAEAERDAHAQNVLRLTQELGGAVSSHRAEISELQTHIASLKADMASRKSRGAGQTVPQTETEAELQEALDALSTLDKALLESQTERDRLVAQLAEARKTGAPKDADRDGKFDAISKELESHRSSIAALQVELSQTRHERDTLASEKQRLESTVRAESPQIPFRRPSDASLTEGRTSRNAINGRSDSPPQSIGYPGGPQRVTKPPPPTPPPTMPPPPLPTSLPSLPSLPGLPGSSINGAVNGSAKGSGIRGDGPRISGTSSSLSRSNSGHESPPGTRTNSFAENVSMDPRVMKKLEEQEAALTKQLSHCESDLKANIDLVSNLESALNDSERNLRKSRLQMNELAKERDKFSSVNDNLREQLAEAQSEVDHARNSVMQEKASFDAKLDEERRAKEMARRQLENRVEEMQNNRLNRKSKFNCF